MATEAAVHRRPIVRGHQRQLFDTINPSTGETPGPGRRGCGRRRRPGCRCRAPRPRRTLGPLQALRPPAGDAASRRPGRAHYDELALLDTLDMGAPISRTILGRRRAVGLLRFYAGLATSVHGDTIANSVPGEVFCYTLKEPVGVVGAINPWNGPIGLAIWKLCPVLASGCTRGAEARRAGAALAAAACGAVPRGRRSAGRRQCRRRLRRRRARRWPQHPGVDKIAFTGSTEVGQKIVRASAGNVKRVSLELGGKSPNVVFADADLDAAVPGAAMAVFANSGQICSAGTRLYVQRPIYEEFVERSPPSRRRCASATRSTRRPSSARWSRPNNSTASPAISALATSRARSRRRRRAPERGALASGYFVAPTVFADVRRRHAHRPRRDLRPGDFGTAVRRRRRCDPPRQRHALRPWQRRLDARRQRPCIASRADCDRHRYGSIASR